MKQIRRILEDVKSYCDYNLEFDMTNGLYKFNDMYIDEIDVNMFDKKIQSLIEDLVSILKVSGKPLPLINDLLHELRVISEPYKNEGLNKYSNFDKLSQLIVETQDNPIKKFESDYTLKELNKFDTKYDENKEELYYYLITKRTEKKPFTDLNEVEKIKLHFTILKYYESVFSFEEFLEELKENIEKYNFSEFDDLLPSEYRHRCTVNYSKMETAHLFNALFKNGILFFPGYVGDNSLKKLCSFMDENFNYVDKRDKNKVEKISKISKEMNYIYASKQEQRQRDILQNLINSLQEIKDKI
jgi:hypothetical protein